MAEKPPEIKIKFISKKGGHAAAHGGAWKIALADLMTAMMAFFLLMWLLNMAPPAVLAGVAGYMREGQDFFKTEMGQSIMQEYGKGILPGTRGLETSGEDDGDRERQNMDEHDAERLAMEAVKIAIENAFDKDQFLSAFKDQISMDFTEEGLRIQINDAGDQPLFDSGSDVMKPFARSVLREIAKELAKLTQHIVVGGHTDSVPYLRAGYSNWELSGDRAQSARRIMMEAGMPHEQIRRVTAYAETVPFKDHDPRDPQNRRLSLVVLSSAYEARERARQRSQAPPRRQ